MQKIFIGNIKPFVEHKFIAVKHASFAYHEYMGTSNSFFSVDTNDIGIEIA